MYNELVAAQSGPNLTPLWIAMGLTWFLGAFFVTWAAREKGRGGGWFLTALILGPFLAALLLIAVPAKEDITSHTARCPFCRSLNAREATVCAHCTRESAALAPPSE